MSATQAVKEEAVCLRIYFLSFFHTLNFILWLDSFLFSWRDSEKPATDTHGIARLEN